MEKVEELPGAGAGPPARAPDPYGGGRAAAPQGAPRRGRVAGGGAGPRFRTAPALAYGLFSQRDD